MKDGIYHDIPEAEYHKLPCLSSTFIKAYSKNPYAAKHLPFKGSPASVLGSCVHKYVLEGKEAFDAEYFALQEFACPEGQNPKGWKSTTKYKELVAMAEMEADGRITISNDQWNIVQGVDASLRKHGLSSQILNRGANELSLIWTDEATGLKCKARLDDYFEGVPSDLKTSNDVEWFHRDIYKRNYHLQAAWYTMGCEANRLPVNYFCFIAAQTTDTFPIRVGYINPDKLIEAKQEVSRLVGLIKESRERDYYPNYAPPVHIYSWDQMTAADLLEEW